MALCSQLCYQSTPTSVIRFKMLLFHSLFSVFYASLKWLCIYLQLQRMANNPDRYFNRGCNLLKEEKERKKLSAELPKV